jgi:excisionase family DNA binding protein
MDKLLTIPEFAEHLRVTVAMVRRMVLEKRVSIIKIGRLVRVPHSELERLIAEGTRPATPVNGRPSPWQR